MGKSVNSHTDQAAENLVPRFDRYRSTAIIYRHRCRCLAIKSRLPIEPNSFHCIAKNLIVGIFGIGFRQPVNFRKVSLAIIGQIIVQ